MDRYLKTFFTALAISMLVAGTAVASNSNVNPTEKVIIGFKDGIDTSLVQAQGGKVTHQYGVINAVAAELPEQAITALQKNPKVAYVEPDYEVHALEQSVEWNIKQINADIVHNYNTGEGIKVAIIDTGIDLDHPDLAENCVGGYDFVNDDDDPMDDNGHGTHCAGIVAAVDNTEGVIGVAPKVDLYAVKVLSSSGGGYSSDVAAGIIWAADEGVQVISMSLGSDSPSNTIRKAVEYASKKGVLLVAAAGNDGNPEGLGDSVDYPARYDSVIAVAATDSNNERAYFSSTGSLVELSAPGYGIYSTCYDDTYDTMSGTSMACPHVAGVAALVFSSPIDTNYDYDGDGSWDADEVRIKLQDTAKDLGPTGRDTLYGFGLVDAYAALSGGTQPADNVPPTAEMTISKTSASVGEIIDFDASLTTDSDGTVVSYSWNFGDGTAGNGITTNHTYSSSRTYTVTLTVTDNEGATDTASGTIEVFQTSTTTPVVTVKVQPVIKSAGKNIFAYATATVTVIQDGNDVSGAVVDGHWEGTTDDYDSAKTEAGIATVVSDSDKYPKDSTLNFIFVVEKITIGGYTYEDESWTGVGSYP